MPTYHPNQPNYYTPSGPPQGPPNPYQQNQNMGPNMPVMGGGPGGHPMHQQPYPGNYMPPENDQQNYPNYGPPGMMGNGVPDHDYNN